LTPIATPRDNTYFYAHKSPRRRIYRESLHACWPDLPENERAQKITEFATQNRWKVTVGDLGTLGVVAEFSRADGSDGA
jgi:hypothetical protein